MDNMKKRGGTGITLLTDHKAPGVFARMPLFNKDAMDLSPSEAVILSWISVSKFEGYGINRKLMDGRSRVKTTLGDMEKAMGTSRRVIRRALDSLSSKELINVEMGNDGVRIEYDLAVSKEFRMVTKSLIVTDIFDFKLKGFIINMMLTTRDYVIKFDNVKHMAGVLGMNRRTVKKYYDELYSLGFVTDIRGEAVIDMREIFIASVNRNSDEIVEMRVKLDKEIDKNEFLIEKLEEMDRKLNAFLNK